MSLAANSQRAGGRILPGQCGLAPDGMQADRMLLAPTGNRVCGRLRDAEYPLYSLDRPRGRRTHVSGHCAAVASLQVASGTLAVAARRITALARRGEWQEDHIILQLFLRRIRSSKRPHLVRLHGKNVKTGGACIRLST